jgi:hypothetical protein
MGGGRALKRFQKLWNGYNTFLAANGKRRIPGGATQAAVVLSAGKVLQNSSLVSAIGALPHRFAWKITNEWKESFRRQSSVVVATIGYAQATRGSQNPWKPN